MTALRPSSRWYNQTWRTWGNYWFILRKYTYEHSLSRQDSHAMVGFNLDGDFFAYSFSYDGGVLEFTDDYLDHSVLPSFMHYDPFVDSLAALGFYEVSGTLTLELRHPWICGATDLRKKTSGYWRSHRYNSATNNPRLCELIDTS